MSESTKNFVVAHFDNYNRHRYSTPWIAEVNQYGKIDFTSKIGIYTGNYYQNDNEGDLVLYNPTENKVYAYGQKDHRGNNTKLIYFIFRDGEMIECDKLGRVI